MSNEVGDDPDRDQPGSGLESLLAQLRRKSDQDAPPPASLPPHGLIVPFPPTMQHRSPTDQYYPPQQHAESPPSASGLAFSAAPPSFSEPLSSSSLPSAPTPPVGGNFPNAAFPPSSLGSIGSGRPIGDRGTSTHLLNLLKFSGHTNPPPSSSLAQPPMVSQTTSTSNPGSEPDAQHTSMTLPASMIHAPAPAPSDPTGLLAALMQGTLKDEPPKPEPPASHPAPWASTSQSNETQQYLLNLLNRPKPSRNDESFSTESSKPTGQTSTSSQHKDYAVFEGAAASPAESPSTLPLPPSTNVFDYEVKDTSADESASFKPKTAFFNHHNPFEGLAASPPIGHTPPQSSTVGGSGSIHSPAHSASSAPKPVQILRKPAPQAGKPASRSSSVERSPAGSPSLLKERSEGPSSRLPLRPSEQATESHISVDKPSDAGGFSTSKKYRDDADAETARESANQSSDDARDDFAANQAAIVQAEISMDLEKMAHAKTEEEFHAAAQAAGRAIQEELGRDDNQSALNETLPPDLAKAVRDIVDEAAQGAVADSWESADAEGEEAAIVEEQSTPVRVYNFPMKPWISIDVQDDDKESRPVFHEESILDIARLKKDFDQIDRNLVAASENYMVYGMSKMGGLRVIRQSDGRDAKLFTDTKDRIFNVAMSSSDSDLGVVCPKDSIIGTGISGTVYWVQIRDGDKDHLDYAHPELYGFALPPIMSHEGDAPGGVLKTRARTSTGHPEYFAVGRGKSINIVWPGFIMQNNLFQPGHDRVVDTEKLSKQCSLKINTGKAGKDFTFSQDDTVIVSLDKSGRVKFWDVRDLTAPSERSGPRNPMPAHSSLEVKEPLMTLTTTPEGEKAWPTSVLLLDKLRPYQKRCALRYMIVGMKQNHTLQLWDLALGKPVQEFNLPHSKESDAVCSVMYHPPTGMIVVGHPTRNSVYFLHLSAPKYSMKNMTQVEYIQRLTARDSSIPQPESTAVISGLREYSLTNRGALRSLDILQNPASNADNDNPTLFELYAMHSKGVSCIFIRQAELGWTNDNKVLDPVDAVDSGKVKIGKLRSPQPAPSMEHHVGESAVAAPQTNGPRFIASRPAASNDLFHSGSAQDTPARKPVGLALTPKLRTAEPKDEDALGHPAAPTTSTPADKAEKKSRKKKAITGSNAATAVAVTASTTGVTAQADRELNISNGSTRAPADSSKAGVQPAPAGKSASVSVSQDAIDSRINTMEARICERVSSSVHVAVDDMRKSIDQQFRARDTDFENKQRKLLDLVSKVLNSNTEQVLSKIVREEFDKSVVPILRDDVARSITDNLGSRINTQVSNVLQRELQRVLPGHVTNSLRSQDVSRAISDKVAHAVAHHVDDQFSKVVATDLLPTISSISTQAVQEITQDLNEKMTAQINELVEFQVAQSKKIDSLLSLVTHLSETVATMATEQAQFQSQLVKLQGQPQPVQPHQGLPPHAPQFVTAQHPQPHLQQHQHAPLAHPPQQQQQHNVQHGLSHHRGYDSGAQAYHSPNDRVANQLVGDHGPSPSQISGPSQQQHQQPQLPPPPPQQQQHLLYVPKSQDELEREEFDQNASVIEDLMRHSKYDDAMMRWLQSNGKEEELFRRVLVNHSPEVISHLQPLVLLSVGTTVTQELDGPFLAQKLSWVEMVILNLYRVANQLDDQTREITPNVLMHIRTRLEQTQLRMTKVSANDGNYKNISRMISIINRIVDATKPRLAF